MGPSLPLRNYLHFKSGLLNIVLLPRHSTTHNCCYVWSAVCWAIGEHWSWCDDHSFDYLLKNWKGAAWRLHLLKNSWLLSFADFFERTGEICANLAVTEFDFDPIFAFLTIFGYPSSESF